MLSGIGHGRTRPNSKRLIAAAVTAGVAATLPMIAAGGASAHTVHSNTAAAKPVAQAPAAAQAPVHQAPAQQAAPAQHTAPATYTVVSGDTLSRIAATHNVQGGWQKLYDMNKSVLTHGPNVIYPGQHLTLAAQAPAAAPAPAKPATPAPQAHTEQAQTKAPVHQAPQAQAKKADTAKPAPKTQAAKPAVTQASFSATGSPQAIAAAIVPANQLASFNQIISHESGWNVTATNPSSGAYGLGQALPGSKMASAGSDWKTNPTTQIKWALDYMNSRYGSPNAAWAFWQTHHWY